MVEVSVGRRSRVGPGPPPSPSPAATPAPVARLHVCSFASARRPPDDRMPITVPAASLAFSSPHVSLPLSLFFLLSFLPSFVSHSFATHSIENIPFLFPTLSSSPIFPQFFFSQLDENDRDEDGNSAAWISTGNLRGARGGRERTCVVHEKVKRRARARARVCASARDGLPVSQCVRQERCIALRRCVKASENARLLARSRVPLHAPFQLRLPLRLRRVRFPFRSPLSLPLSPSLPPLSPAKRRKPPPPLLSSPLLSAASLPPLGARAENTPWDGRREGIFAAYGLGDRSSF